MMRDISGVDPISIMIAVRWPCGSRKPRTSNSGGVSDFAGPQQAHLRLAQGEAAWVGCTFDCGGRVAAGTEDSSDQLSSDIPGRAAP
jgi:hypothetical protein